MVYVSVVIARF